MRSINSEQVLLLSQPRMWSISVFRALQFYVKQYINLSAEAQYRNTKKGAMPWSYYYWHLDNMTMTTLHSMVKTNSSSFSASYWVTNPLNELTQRPPTFWTPGISSVKISFSMDGGWWGVSCAACVLRMGLCLLVWPGFLHAVARCQSTDQRLGTPELTLTSHKHSHNSLKVKQIHKHTRLFLSYLSIIHVMSIHK